MSTATQNSSTEVPTPQPLLNVDNIAELTRKTLDKIKADPKQLGTILSQLENNQEVLGQVLRTLDSNPAFKQQAISSIKGRKRDTEGISKMSSHERRKMVVQAKRAKAAAAPSRVQALIINNSRQIKPFMLVEGKVPASRHTEDCCAPHVINWALELHYCRNASPVNKRAEKVLGMRLGGEVLLVRRDREGRVQHLEECEIPSLLRITNDESVLGETQTTTSECSCSREVSSEQILEQIQ